MKGKDTRGYPYWGYPPTARPEHNTENSLPYSFRTVREFFYVPQNSEQRRVARRGRRVIVLTSEKIRVSNHLLLSLQRQHFLLRYWKARNENSSQKNASSHYSNYSYSGLMPNKHALNCIDWELLLDVKSSFIYTTVTVPTKAFPIVFESAFKEKCVSKTHIKLFTVNSGKINANRVSHLQQTFQLKYTQSKLSHGWLEYFPHSVILHQLDKDTKCIFFRHLAKP